MKKTLNSTRTRVYRKLFNASICAVLGCLVFALSGCSESFVSEKQVAEEVKAILPSFKVECDELQCSSPSSDEIWDTIMAQLSSNLLPVQFESIPIVLYDRHMDPSITEDVVQSVILEKHAVDVLGARRIFNYNLQMNGEDLAGSSRYAGINAEAVKNGLEETFFNAILYFMNKEQFCVIRSKFPLYSLIPVVVRIRGESPLYSVAYMFSATADVFGLLTLPGVLPNPEVFNELWEIMSSETVKTSWGESFPQDYLLTTLLGSGKPITTLE
ncbi:hypothetical protein [Chlamydiifrater phoenicopteri]|uniref:hypothetical protein n=1 Tax=Chlamydiifrater phoenicopteri TaxID=2681469 RepID=UPI001BD0DDD2|nr:hypothetical protein [Chlamydiifrater phoenicopteri]